MLKQKLLEAKMRKIQIEAKRRKPQESGNNVETSLIKYTNDKYLVEKGHYNTLKPRQNIRSSRDKTEGNYKAFHGHTINVKKLE